MTHLKIPFAISPRVIGIVSPQDVEKIRLFNVSSVSRGRNGDGHFLFQSYRVLLSLTEPVDLAATGVAQWDGSYHKYLGLGELGRKPEK